MGRYYDEDGDHERGTPAYDEPWEHRFKDLWAVTPREPTWLIKDLLPTGLVFVGAPAKAGKSHAVLAISLLVAGYQCKAFPARLSKVELGGPVQIFSFEADAGDLRSMAEKGLKVTGEPNEGILVCDEPSLFQIDTKAGAARLMHWLKGRQPRLAILDPLVNFHTSDENNAGEMAAILSPLRQWAVDNEACMLVVHHARKLAPDRATYDTGDMRGTSAFFGLANGVLIFTPKGNSQLLVKATFKRGRSWEQVINFATYDARENAHDDLTGQDEAVLAVLTNTPTVLDEVLKKLPNFDRPSLATSIRRLVALGYIVQDGMSGYRRL